MRTRGGCRWPAAQWPDQAAREARSTGISLIGPVRCCCSLRLATPRPLSRRRVPPTAGPCAPAPGPGQRGDSGRRIGADPHQALAVVLFKWDSRSPRHDARQDCLPPCRFSLARSNRRQRIHELVLAPGGRQGELELPGRRRGWVAVASRVTAGLLAERNRRVCWRYQAWCVRHHLDALIDQGREPHQVRRNQ